MSGGAAGDGGEAGSYSQSSRTVSLRNLLTALAAESRSSAVPASVVERDLRRNGERRGESAGAPWLTGELELRVGRFAALEWVTGTSWSASIGGLGRGLGRGMTVEAKMGAEGQCGRDIVWWSAHARHPDRMTSEKDCGRVRSRTDVWGLKCHASFHRGVVARPHHVSWLRQIASCSN